MTASPPTHSLETSPPSDRLSYYQLFLPGRVTVLVYCVGHIVVMVRLSHCHTSVGWLVSSALCSGPGYHCEVTKARPEAKTCREPPVRVISQQSAPSAQSSPQCTINNIKDRALYFLIKFPGPDPGLGWAGTNLGTVRFSAQPRLTESSVYRQLPVITPLTSPVCI